MFKTNSFTRRTSFVSYFLFGLALLVMIRSHGGTLATFRTSVGTMELQFFDEDKPITVSNFIKYVTSGRFNNQFIQRWEPNFVIQGGGFRVTDTNAGPIQAVQTFGMISNEYKVGKTYSNTYGTIAMARQGGVVNSASSQWYLNLTNNSGLDKVDEGFTVFGSVIAGTNVLNLFIPPPPTNGIYRVDASVISQALSTLPVRKPVTTVEQLYTNLIYVDISLRRDVALNIRPSRPGQRLVGWTTVTGVTNILEYSSSLTGASWTTVTNVLGTGASYGLVDSSADRARIYRVRVVY